MGMFAGTVFIRNEEDQAKEMLIEKFNQYMNKNGYIPSDSDNAERKYCFAFPEGKWFALVTSEEELPGKGSLCAKAFDAYTIAADLVDSDFVVLELYQPDGISIDHETIGEPYWGDEDMFGESDLPQWFRFLKAGVSEEELTAALNDQEVFAESAFSKFGELIEMDASPLWLDKNNPEEDTTVILYFKKK